MNKSPLFKTSLTEQHFTVGALAKQWGVSEDTIRRWFADIPGVLKFGSAPGRGRRPRMSLRIPESIALNVYAEKIK